MYCIAHQYVYKAYANVSLKMTLFITFEVSDHVQSAGHTESCINNCLTIYYLAFAALVKN